MKRKILATMSVVAATAAFAAPASATDLSTSTDMQIGTLCHKGEPTDTCILRVTGELLYKAGDEAEKGIQAIMDACRRHLSGCSIPQP